MVVINPLWLAMAAYPNRLCTDIHETTDHACCATARRATGAGALGASQGAVARDAGVQQFDAVGAMAQGGQYPGTLQQVEPGLED